MGSFHFALEICIFNTIVYLFLLRCSYETENGIAAQERGQWRQINAQEGAHIVEGSYRFPLQDGRVQIVEYQADENGYRPVIKYQ